MRIIGQDELGNVDMGEGLVLWIVIQMPFNTPMLLEDETRYNTHYECQAAGKEKAVDIAQEMADNIVAPIGYKYWCEGEERTGT